MADPSGSQPVAADDLVIVSVDDHLVEPPDMFEGRLPRRFADRAPRVIERPDGREMWLFEGVEIPNFGLNAVSGRPQEEFGIEPTRFDEIRAGCWDVDRRVEDMNAGGVLASMCFPSFPQFCGQIFATTDDKELALAVLRAYNDWHVEDWCGAHPGRFLPLGLLPYWDPELMAAEVRRLAERDVHAVTWSENPEKLGVPSFHNEHWDPFWRACDDTGTVVCLHIGSSSQVKLPSIEAPFTTMMNLQPTAVMDTAADLLWSRVIREFPNVRFALSEGSIGWIPYLLERADYVLEHHQRWTGSDFGGRLPSEVFRDHFVACFIEDRAGLRLLDLIGPDIVCVETDYPHSDSTWPRSPERLAASMAQLPRATVDAICHGNAMRIFDFDPFRHRPRERCTVAALRDEAAGVDVGPTPPRRDFVPPERPLTLLDMLQRAEHPLLDEQARTEGVGGVTDLVFVDGDGHLLEPPTALVDFAPGPYRERIWQVRVEDDGVEYLTLDDMRMEAAVMALAAAGGFDEETRVRAHSGQLAYHQLPGYCWDAEARLAALDGDGIAQSVLYPTMLLTFQHLRTLEFAEVQCRTYNDWLSDLCARGRGRLHGVALLPQLDPERAAAEIRRVAGLPHIVGVQVRPNPAMGWHHLNHEVYDPIWQAASETGLPVGFHPLSSNDLHGAVEGLRLAKLGTSDIPVQDQEDFGSDNIFFAQAIGNPVDMMTTVTFMTAGGVLTRFPDLRVVFLEANGGWIVPWLERLDHHWRIYGWDVPWLHEAPSEVFRRQCWISFDVDESTLCFTARSPLVGADRIIWASDFPHPDAKYPGTTATLAATISELDPAAQAAIAGGNAATLYGIDLVP